MVTFVDARYVYSNLFNLLAVYLILLVLPKVVAAVQENQLILNTNSVRHIHSHLI